MSYVPPQHQPYLQGPPRRTSTNAIVALIMGVLGFVACPLIGSILAIVFATMADREFALDPSLDGAQLAKAGKILGIIGVVLVGVAVVFYIVAIGLLVGSTAGV